RQRPTKRARNIGAAFGGLRVLGRRRILVRLHRRRGGDRVIRVHHGCTRLSHAQLFFVGSALADAIIARRFVTHLAHYFPRLFQSWIASSSRFFSSDFSIAVSCSSRRFSFS